jgi:hypothetical protein
LAEKSAKFVGAVNLGVAVRLATELRLYERRVLTGDFVLIPEDGKARGSALAVGARVPRTLVAEVAVKKNAQRS